MLLHMQQHHSNDRRGRDFRCPVRPLLPVTYPRTCSPLFLIIFHLSWFKLYSSFSDKHTAEEEHLTIRQIPDIIYLSDVHRFFRNRRRRGARPLRPHPQGRHRRLPPRVQPLRPDLLRVSLTKIYIHRFRVTFTRTDLMRYDLDRRNKR